MEIFNNHVIFKSELVWAGQKKYILILEVVLWLWIRLWVGGDGNDVGVKLLS